MQKPKQKFATCAGCKKPKKLAARGLCASCHVAASREVKAKRETWESLERKKLALPPRQSAFRKALNKAK